MKILKAVKGRKAQKGQYVVTVLVDESELTELAPEQFSEMKMAISHSDVVPDKKPVRPKASLDKEAHKWLEAYRAMESEFSKV